MALGIYRYLIIRSTYTPYSIYLRATIGVGVTKWPIVGTLIMENQIEKQLEHEMESRGL